LVNRFGLKMSLHAPSQEFMREYANENHDFKWAKSSKA
jgi:hypothetical protein